MSSPTARLIRNFTEEVGREYEDEFGDYNQDRDFRFAIWSNYTSGMLRRFCIQDDGIEREGCVIGDGAFDGGFVIGI
jgi:hypothetical protein